MLSMKMIIIIIFRIMAQPESHVNLLMSGYALPLVALDS